MNEYVRDLHVGVIRVTGKPGSQKLERIVDICQINQITGSMSVYASRITALTSRSGWGKWS